VTLLQWAQEVKFPGPLLSKNSRTFPGFTGPMPFSGILQAWKSQHFCLYEPWNFIQWQLHRRTVTQESMAKQHTLLPYYHMMLLITLLEKQLTTQCHNDPPRITSTILNGRYKQRANIVHTPDDVFKYITLQMYHRYKQYSIRLC